ncbi:MAG: matrixin family metalloprotease [Gemmatimonadaceae bacterium]
MKSDRVVLGAVIVLGAFVVGEVALGDRPRSALPPAPRLSRLDSARVRRSYAAQIAAMSGRYQPPAWIRDVQLERLFADVVRIAATRHQPAPDSERDARAAATGDVLRRARVGTYLDAVLAMNHEVVIRWRASDEPIRVWVQPRSSERGFDAAFPEVTRAAFRKWSELGLGVTFTITADSTEGDVVVTWSARMPSSEQLGYTFRLADERGEVVLAHVILSTTVDVYAVQNTALHEAGHVLGLEHSPAAADMMSATTEGRQYRLTDADRNTARLLYQLPPGAIK